MARTALTELMCASRFTCAKRVKIGNFNLTFSGWGEKKKLNSEELEGSK